MRQFITKHARQKCLDSLLFVVLNSTKPQSLNGWGRPGQLGSFYGIWSLIIIVGKPFSYLEITLEKLIFIRGHPDFQFLTHSPCHPI